MNNVKALRRAAVLLLVLTFGMLLGRGATWLQIVIVSGLYILWTLVYDFEMEKMWIRRRQAKSRMEKRG